MYRFAAWYPELVTHVFSICTPYTAPSSHYVSLEDLVKRAPQFGYQIHLASGDVEANINTPEKIREFLSGIYGGRSPAGKPCFNPRTGIVYESLPGTGKSPLFSDPVSDKEYRLSNA